MPTRTPLFTTFESRCRSVSSCTLARSSKRSLDVTAEARPASELTEHEKTISELRERLAAIVESSDDAILSKNLNGIIQSWNKGAERIFGYTASEIIGQHISTLAPPGCSDEMADILQRIARGERVEHYETRRKTKTGRILN